MNIVNRLVFPLSVAFLVGCAVLQPTADPVVVRAEPTTAVAFSVLDNFQQWEFRNKPTVGADVHAFAETLRKESPKWLATARVLTKNYKLNKTPENKANLLTAIAVLETAMAEAQKNLAKGTTP